MASDCDNGFAITGSVGLVSRFGQFYKAVDPGLVQVNVCTESLRVVDVKIQIISIGRQSVITRDNVNVEMYVPLLLLPSLSNKTQSHTVTLSFTSKSRTRTAPRLVSRICARR